VCSQLLATLYCSSFWCETYLGNDVPTSEQFVLRAAQQAQ